MIILGASEFKEISALNLLTQFSEPLKAEIPLLGMKNFQKIENRLEWQELLNKALFKTFFHNLEWEEFLEKNFSWLKFEHYLYQEQALLSLSRVRVLGKEKLISHPFCEYGGALPLVDKIDFSKFQEDLFSEFKTPIKISFHPYLFSYFSNVMRTVLLTSRDSYFIKNFPLSLRKTTRYEIKKAENWGPQIKKCENKKELSSFYDLYVKTAMRHKGLPYPFSFFQYFFNSPETEIILAKCQEKVVAGSVFLFYDGFCHYFLNASDERYRNLGPNYLILWSQIKKYLQKDYLPRSEPEVLLRGQIFDLGGTRVGSSLETFKRGWGANCYSIFELRNYQEGKIKESKLRNVLGFLPAFLVKRFNSYLLKYKL